MLSNDTCILYFSDKVQTEIFFEKLTCGKYRVIPNRRIPLSYANIYDPILTLSFVFCYFPPLSIADFQFL